MFGLPTGAKYLAYVNSKELNPEREIVWSFTYALTGNDHVLSTFLTTNESLTSLPATDNPINSDVILNINLGHQLKIETATSTLTADLSGISTSFILASAQKNDQILRFSLSNVGKTLDIDYKGTRFTTLTSVTLPTTLNMGNVYCGFSFASPLLSTSDASTLFLQNFHVYGSDKASDTESTTFTALTASKLTTYTTISGISARL